MVVEGDDDARFWMPRKHGECEIVDGEGKPNVIAGVRRIDGAGVQGVLGIVDEDYDCLQGKSMGSENLVAVCPHDLECLLFQSSALKKVLSEYGSHRKIASFEKSEGVDVREALLARAEIFGRVRWADLRFCLDINWKGIKVPRFVDFKTWNVDEVGLVRAAASGWEGELRRYIGLLPDVERWRVVRGHDALETLRIGLKQVLGNLAPGVGIKELGRVLRSGIDGGELRATKLWRDMCAWQGANDPYRVLEVAGAIVG